MLSLRSYFYANVKQIARNWMLLHIKYKYDYDILKYIDSHVARFEEQAEMFGIERNITIFKIRRELTIILRKTYNV